MIDVLRLQGFRILNQHIITIKVCVSMINSNSKFVYAFICRLDNSSHLFSFRPILRITALHFNLTSSDKLTNDQSVKNHLDIKRRRSLGSSTLAHASG